MTCALLFHCISLSFHCIKYVKIRFFSNLYFPVWEQNLRFWPYTGRYGSKSSHSGMIWTVLFYHYLCEKRRFCQDITLVNLPCWYVSAKSIENYEKFTIHSLRKVRVLCFKQRLKSLLTSLSFKRTMTCRPTNIWISPNIQKDCVFF